MCKLTNCNFCLPNQAHNCRICNAVDDHFSIACPNAKKLACVFNCGHCAPGKPHYCRTCGAYNHHRSQDCLGKPHRDAILANAPAPRAPAYAPANAPAYAPANAPAYAPAPTFAPTFARTAAPTFAPTAARTAAPTFAPTAAAPTAAAPTAAAPTAAAIVVIWDDKILIQKRASWLGGKYATPGGAIDPLETAEDAALREVNEEAGLLLDSSNMMQLGSIHPTNNFCKTIIVKYTGGSNPIFGYASAARECGQIPSSILGDHACHGHKWMTKDQIETLINKNMFLGPALPAIREAFKLMKKP
jgi:8-oxo-dGTP pyrophosphatase MutT (NUDIX family)